MTNNPINIDTRFIADITPDPKFIARMVAIISDALEDDLSDYCFQIITDYCSADAPEGIDQQDYEDAIMDQVHNPLYDRIALGIFARCISPWD